MNSDLKAAIVNQVHLPPRGGWAYGDYFKTCSRCTQLFLGDARAFVCGVCEYKEDEE